jgi:lysyl-tRNA synthetase, class II
LPFEPLEQYLQRQRKLAEIEALGYEAYPHRFDPTATPAEITARYADADAADLEARKPSVRVAGRVMTMRLHGKAGFAHILGDGQRLQIYLKLDVLGERAFQFVKLLDLGDSIGVSGHIFRTKTGELTVWVEQIVLLAKALLPLPEKFHGLADRERRYRQRYLDLIVNEDSRRVFMRRAQIVRELRRFFDAHGYIEVETPMMQSIAGGAAARPFITHHNTMDVDLYLRIAPELYLKRLIVGGLDRVYEINRNFRNEGISTQHNPEFTMLEFYQAYSDYRDLMSLTEELFAALARQLYGTTVIRFGEHEIDLGRWQRLTMREAIVRYWPAAAAPAPTVEELAAAGGPHTVAARYNAWAASTRPEPTGTATAIFGADPIGGIEKMTDGEITGALFEHLAEHRLIQPTIVYDFPTDISPLAKCKPGDPSLVERFEIFIVGMEFGNAFSELNDPAEQERRFEAQVKEGSAEAPREVDLDYVRALAHGMPPTAGQGIGIDRLAMLLTDSHSIRDVILFPLLRPESRGGAAPDAGDDTDGGATGPPGETP